MLHVATRAQGEDGPARWVLFMLGFYVLGAMSVVALALSLMWVVHIIIYLLPPRPLGAFLNTFFVTLDGVFPLFGVLAFSLFCLYFMVVAMKGNFMMGGSWGGAPGRRVSACVDLVVVGIVIADTAASSLVSHKWSDVARGPDGDAGGGCYHRVAEPC